MTMYYEMCFNNYAVNKICTIYYGGVDEVSLNFTDVKKRFDDEWIAELCDRLESNNKFFVKNRFHILESLKHAIEKHLTNIDEGHFNDQRMAYLFVLEQLELELTQLYLMNK